MRTTPSSGGRWAAAGKAGRDAGGGAGARPPAAGQTRAVPAHAPRSALFLGDRGQRAPTEMKIAGVPPPRSGGSGTPAPGYGRHTGTFAGKSELGLLAVRTD